MNSMGMKRPLENGLERNYWPELDDAVTAKIMSMLPFEDVLNFEAASLWHSRKTNDYWVQKKSTKFFNIDWSDSGNSAKYSFILSKAIHAYVYYRTNFFNGETPNERISKIYRRFEGLMLRFPLFGAYIWSDLKSINPQLLSPHQRQFEMNRVLLKQPSSDNLNGGDHLLYGLYKISFCLPGPIPFPNKCEITKTFTKAIQLNATCASYFAFKLRYDTFEWHASLGDFSKEKGDYRALDNLYKFKQNKANIQYNRAVFIPSVLAIASKCALTTYGNDLEINKNEILGILKQAEEAYGEENVPLDLWESFDVLMDGDERIDEYKTYISKAMKLNNSFTNSYDGCVDANFKMICRHFQLGEWKEAEIKLDLEFSLNIYGRKPLSLYIRHAYVKFKLEKWEEANLIYGNLINLVAYQDINQHSFPAIYTHVVQQAPHDKKDKFEIGLWRDFAFTCLKVKDFKRALLHIKKCFKALEYSNFDLEFFKEWKVLYDEIKNNFLKEGVNFPSSCSINYMGVMIENALGNWNEVVALHGNESLLGNETPRHLGYAYFKLKNWELAEPIYDVMKQRYDIRRDYCKINNPTTDCEGWQDFDCISDALKNPTEFDADYATLKINLGKFDEANEICLKTLQFYNEESKYCIKVSLTFCEKMIEAYGEKAPEFLLKELSRLQAKVLK